MEIAKKLIAHHCEWKRNSIFIVFVVGKLVQRRSVGNVFPRAFCIVYEKKDETKAKETLQTHRLSDFCATSCCRVSRYVCVRW